MIPSREHFLLKRRNALSTFSFSPTLTVDILFTILCLCVYSLLRYYINFTLSCQVFFRRFYNLFTEFSILCRPDKSMAVVSCQKVNLPFQNPRQGACTTGKRNPRAIRPPRKRNRKFCKPTCLLPSALPPLPPGAWV